MPRAKIDYIVSFSSEDKENQANNLLSWEINKKKWLCQEGEPSCSVVLQLAKAIQIESVNIGVHHSALVEVLVGLSEKPNDPFEVLVPSCVFVSAADSRRGEGAERVRSFSGTQLAGARERRWDRVRVVCSQPYNKRVKYGLTFVHVYSAGEAPPLAPPTASRLLALDTFSSDEDEFRPGELFAQRNAPPTNNNTDAQIRLASSQALNNISDISTKLVKTPIAKNNKTALAGERQQTDRQRDSIMYTDDDDRPHDKIDRLVRSHHEQKNQDASTKKRNLSNSQERPSKKRNIPDSQERPAEKRNIPDSQERPAEKRNIPDSQERPAEKRNSPDCQEALTKRERVDASKQQETSKAKDKAKKHYESDKPQSKQTGPILQGVVFSLSGYENPRRARVRDAAVALGARFEPHALRRCTHLVCAFPNTPKLRELQRVAPAAHAVRAEWVEHTAVAGQRLPEPPYAPGKPLPPAPTPPPTHTEHISDADTDDEIERVMQARPADPDGSDTECDEPDAGPSGTEAAEGRGGGVSDTECDDPMTIDDVVASGSDTETDEPPPPCREPKVVPTLFDGEQFALDSRLSSETRALLARYLRAYGALVVQADELDDDSAVDYVVSEQQQDRAGATCVTPRWVWRCHRKGRLPPTAR